MPAVLSKNPTTKITKLKLITPPIYSRPQGQSERMAEIKKGKSRLTQNMSFHHMPVFKKDDKVLLMLMLTDLTEQQKRQLVDFLEADLQVINGGVKVQTWTPSKCLLNSIAVQGLHRDSLANVHALAMLAYQSGLEFLFHTSFVVADDLTKRCWDGTHRVGELGLLSLLMVSVRPEILEKTSPPISSLPPRVRVITYRFSDTSDQLENFHFRGNISDSDLTSDDFVIYDCFSMGAPPTVIKQYKKHGLLPFILEEFRWEDHNSFLRDVPSPEYHCKIRKLYHLFKPGAQRSYSISYRSIYLRDPDQEIFSTSGPRLSTRKQYLEAAWSALSSRLPPELSTEIISRADLVPAFRAPLWRRRQGQNHLHIFMMFPTTKDDLHEAHLIIHDALERRSKDAPKTTELIPLHRHGMRTRRDVVAFWEEYRMHEPDERCNDPLLYLMINPIQNQAVNSSHFAIVSSGGGRPVSVLRTTLETLCIVSKLGLIDQIARDYDNYNVDLVEATYNPEQPYYYTPPIWEAVRNVFTDEYLCAYDWISVFYLTKHLTDSEDLLLRKEIHKVDGQDRYGIDPVNYNTEQRKDVCFVSWELDEDGTLDDIWNIVLKIYKHEGFGRRFVRFFCLDRQSVEDQTLIIVEPDFFLAGRKVQEEGELLQGMVAPTLAGFRCNRVPCEDAHDSKFELDACERTIEEVGGLGNEGQHFIRPGWPGPDVLPPTNPWRLGWPEPSQPGTVPVWNIFGSRLDTANEDENEERGEE